MKVFIVLMLMCVACGDDTSASDGGAPDAAPTDSGVRPDGELEDSNVLDSHQDAPDPADSGADAPIDAAERDGGDAAADGGMRDGGTSVRLPPMNGRFDYQLGGDYPPPDGITIVERDRGGAPAAGLYNICYVNGYQTQPGESGDWDESLFLRDSGGDPFIDADWPGEIVLDISTADKRMRIAAQVGGWISRCAADGFDAVEIDNLDTYSRASDATVRITQDDAVALMVLLVGYAHDAGLAIAQKNAAELLGRRGEMGTDFVVVEECSQYDECAVFTDAYGAMVLMVEYRQSSFEQGCAMFGSTHAIVLRDLGLELPAHRRYVFDDC